MKTAILAIGLLVLSTSTPARAEPANRENVVGTWKLVSASATIDGREKNPTPFGANPRGFIAYERDGTMTVMVSYDGRKPLSGDRVGAPAAERAEAFATFFAYTGRYTAAGGKISHHVEIASYPNWVGTDLVRDVKVEGRRLTILTPPVPVGGRAQSTELVFERVK
jgi:hypothetical protein